MKKLYIEYDDRGSTGNPRTWIMVIIAIFTLINSCILMAITTTSYIDEKGVIHSKTPVWSILTINLVPLFPILFWFFTTNEKPEEDSKKYIRIEKPSDIDLRDKYQHETN